MKRCAVRAVIVLLRASKVVVLAFEQFRPTPMRQLTVSFGKRWNRRLKTAYLYYLREKKKEKNSHEKREMLLTFVVQSQYCDCDGG